jgi:outer membrane protein OmpA-like peptidoglycan-associated protein
MGKRVFGPAGRVAALTATVVGLAAAQAPAGRIPLGTGAAIVQTLSAVGSDRESVHRVRLVSDSGLHYEWRLEEVMDTGDTVRQEFRYLEAWVDLDGAKRLRGFHDRKAPEAHPGYTMHALSRATYRRLQAGQPDSFQVMAVDQDPGSSPLRLLGFGGARVTPVRWRGTLALVAPGTVPFPVLLNGRRVELRALHLQGDLTARQGTWQPQFWVLADSTYPLILKWIGAFREPGNVLQTTRIDLPAELSAERLAAGEGVLLVGREGSGKVSAAALERELAVSCRVELPGIYFAFNSAHLDPASDHAIAAIADILARHPAWSATLEGHTDSIGSAEANQALSERRVEAVRARLVAQHRVTTDRIRVAGYGAARPREPNGTIEGRARNRRVELVRDCQAQHPREGGQE